MLFALVSLCKSYTCMLFNLRRSTMLVSLHKAYVWNLLIISSLTVFKNVKLDARFSTSFDRVELLGSFFCCGVCRSLLVQDSCASTGHRGGSGQ